MNNETHISKRYVYFTFPWRWIKDKQIIHRGNNEYGMLIITDDEGKAVKMYGYELIGHEEDNRNNKE